jgi:cytochrome P450
VTMHPQTVGAFPFERSGNMLNPPFQYEAVRSSSGIAKVKMWNGLEAWILTRWSDVREALASPDFSVQVDTEGFPTTSAAREANLRERKVFISMDQPDHTKFRRMLTREFMVKRVADYRPLVDSLVKDLMDELGSHGAPADFADIVARPLPANVISALLGVPHEDHEILGRLSSIRNDHTASPELIRQSMAQLLDYLGNTIDEKIKNPEKHDDLLGRLAADQIKPGHLSRDEAVRMAVLLYSAGHETTGSQIGLGTLNFLLNPDQRHALVEDPSRLPAAVEEMLRYNTIAHLNSARVATKDVTIGGHLIRKGEGVFPLVAAANRDPAMFAEPDRFDITRESHPHLAFAYGIHQCLGQPLARLELTAVFAALFDRFPKLELAVPRAELHFTASAQVFRVDALPVRW